MIETPEEFAHAVIGIVRTALDRPVAATNLPYMYED